MANKIKRSLENTRGLDVDKRSDTTRQGYHEGIPSSIQSHSYHPFLDIANEIDRKTNMSRQDSPIYHSGLITGEAPGVGGITKARNALEALEMIKAMKAAKSAKQLKTVERINKVKPTASYEINSTAKNYASRPIINEVRQPATPKPRPVRTEEERQAIIQKGLETRRANAAKLSEEELAQKKANKIAKIKATMEQHSVKNHSWQHTKRNNEYSRQELLDIGLNNEDFSRHIITQRGGKTWVSDMKYGGSINIAPSKRGTFTAAASKHGMGVQEFASRVLRNKDSYSPAMVKKANFARNASKWNH